MTMGLMQCATQGHLHHGQQLVGGCHPRASHYIQEPDQVEAFRKLEICLPVGYPSKSPGDSRIWL